MPYLGNHRQNALHPLTIKTLTGGSGTSFTLDDLLVIPKRLRCSSTTCVQPGVAYRVEHELDHDR